ncbi:MAG: putative toxin-antitoxin system toxin component, PIN family [Proteobacteria bacterium]|nr:putative toxin-antitoxin system toxin component, PIN family [Pseudomonadota bacterium]
MRVVLDTCVVVSALRSSKGASFRVLEHVLENQMELGVSNALMLEYEEVLFRPGIVPLQSTEIIDFLDSIGTLATWVNIDFKLRPLADDPADDIVVECAYNFDGVLVTHNLRDFLAAGETVIVVPPVAILKYLEAKR